MNDLSALGSAHDIAAAAMAAAGLDVLMKDGGSEGEKGIVLAEHGVVTAEDEKGMTDEAEVKAEGAGSDGFARGKKRPFDAVLDRATSQANGHATATNTEAHSPKRSNSSVLASTIAPQVDLSQSIVKQEEGQHLTSKLASEPTATAKKGVSTMGSSLSKPQPPNFVKRPSPTVTSAQSNTSASAALALLSGIHNLEAVAQAAMGLDANGNPLPGNEESHRALAEAVKRLNAAQGGNGDRSAGSSSRFGEGGSAGNDDPTLKRFQCHLCDRAFARAYNLNTHLATHDPDPAKSKPFSCPYPSCKADGGRSFSRKHDLQRHVASTHDNEPAPEDEEEIDENGTRISIVAKLGLGTPGRKFRCEDCGRAFVRRDALRRHQCLPQQLPTSSASPPSEDNVAVKNYRPMNNVPSPSSTALPAIPSGLSLYTSTAPSQVHPPGTTTAKQGKVASSIASGNAPFYSEGLSYESLSREVQDMAMQLVAQATTYNQAHQPSKINTDVQSSKVVSEQKDGGRPGTKSSIAVASARGT